MARSLQISTFDQFSKRAGTHALQIPKFGQIRTESRQFCTPSRQLTLPPGCHIYLSLLSECVSQDLLLLGN